MANDKAKKCSGGVYPRLVGRDDVGAVGGYKTRPYQKRFGGMSGMIGGEEMGNPEHLRGIPNPNP
jgi:hypothetical protein